MKVLQPPMWPKPKGYANGIAAEGELVFISGQIGWDEKCKIVSDDIAIQTQQVLKNIEMILKEAGSKPEHVVRMTWYVIDKKEYSAAGKSIGEMYRSIFGSHYPAMTLVEVSGLLEDGAKVEIEATAVIPKK